MKTVIARAVVLGSLIVALAACGDNQNTPPQPDTAFDAPPYVDPAFLTIDHATNPFGSILVDQSSSPALFRITNTGDEASGIPTVSLAGPDASAFATTNTCTSALVPGGVCTVAVTFTPTSAGAKTATLSVSATPGGTVMAALTGTGLAPGALTLTVTPSALGSVVVGETGATTALVTVMNDGGAATGVLALQPAGADPVDFTTSDDTCTGQTLASSASCTFRIALAPRSAGPKSSEFRISATPGGSLDAAVTGTGLAPARLVATPLHRGFGTVVTNATSSTGIVTVTNTGDVASSTLGVTVSGTDAAMFTPLGTSTCTGTLAAGTSCQVHVAFTPISTGAKQALLAISGAGTASATLAGTGIPAGQLTITPTAHAFGNVNVGTTSAARELTITNGSGSPTGLLTTTLIGANASGLQIVAGTDECTGVSLQPGEACTISVAFAPTRHGFADAELVVAGAPGGTVATSLTGIGIGPAQLAITPPSRGFGGVATGDVSAPLVFTVTNIGGQASSAPTVAFGGTGAGQFQPSSSTCTIALAPGGVCTVAVTFAPTAPGAANATLEVSATTGGTVSSALTGEGLAPGNLVFVPPVVQFAPLAVGETTEQTLTVVNTGAVDAGQVFINLDGPNYVLAGTTCTNLAPNASCAVTVRFAPTTVGTGIAGVTAASPNAGATTAALHGTISPRLEVIAINGGPVTSPYDVGQAIVNNTTPHDARITVRNNTATAQPLSLSDTFNGQYQVISNTCDATDMIASHGTCTVGVRFAPTTTGTKTGTLTFAIGTGFTNQAAQSFTGTAIEALVLTPLGGTDFGAVPLNTQSSVLRFRVTNPTGSVTTGALSTTLTGASMTIVANTCAGQPLVAAATCDIDVRFAPTVAANVTGTLGVSAMPGGAPSVTLTANGIEPLGAAPTAITLTPGTVTEGSPAGTSAGTLASIDADVGQTYTYVLVGGTGSDDNSAFTLAGDQVRTNGVFDYETKASYSIRVRTTDSGGFTLEQVIVIEVVNVDERPTAVDDSATVAEDSGATTIDVRANDTDIDAGPKTIESVTQPANGQVAITGGGNSLTYQPNANFAGTDTFTYTLNGGSLATVTVTVTPVDDAPVAVNDSVTVLEDSGTTAIDVRANDTDIDGGARTITAITQPAAGQGTVAITGGGTGVSYTTGTNYAGTTSFTYTLDGGSTAIVTVTITAVDDPAVAVNDAYTVAEDATATTLDILANDTDTDGGTPVAIQSVAQPANGTVVMVGTTAVTYKPDADFAGTDTFTYTLVGGSTATVSVTVTAVDDAPIAVDDAATVAEDAGATAIPVLTNDTDIDGGSNSINSVTQPAHGTVEITGGGAGLTYAPAANYCNAPPSTALDTFTYTLNGNDTATVTITVTCANDWPSALMLAPGTIAENAPTGTVAGTFTSTDVDSTAFTYVLVAGPGSTNNASFTIVGNELRSTASFNFEATPTLAIRVRTIDDAGGFLDQALVVTVTNANEAPTDFTPASSPLAENQPLGATVATLGGTDPDAADTFTYSLVAGTGSTDNAQFTIAGNVLRVAAVQDYEASSTKTRSVRIQVTDAGGLTFARAHVITITNVDEAPTSIALTGTTFPETAGTGVLVGSLSANDPEGGTLTYSLVAGTGSADNSKFAIVGTQLQTATTYDFETQSAFQVRIRVTDSTSLTVEQTVTLTATDVNEAPVDGDETINSQAHVGVSVAAPGLLANAVDPDAGSTVTADVGTFITAQSGRLIVAANGAYTYQAPAGVSGTTDTVTYTVRDQQGVANTSTLTINIDSNPIWFVDLAAPVNGDGTLALPASKLPPSSFSSAGTIFVYTSDTSTGNSTETGTFQLLANQRILGEGVSGAPGATINTYLGYTTYPGSLPLPTINGPRHTVARYLSLTGDSSVRDLDIGGLAATNFGSLTVDHVAIKNATVTSSFAAPVRLQNGVAAITLDQLTGTTPGGITLTNVSGNITIASGSLTSTSGDLLDASGGVSFTHNGMLTSTGGTGIKVANTTGPFTFANVALNAGNIVASNATGKLTFWTGATANGGLVVTGASGGIDFFGSMTQSTPTAMVDVNGATGTAPINITGNLLHTGTPSIAVWIRNSSVPVAFDGPSKQLNGDVHLQSNSGEIRFRNGGLKITNGQLYAGQQTGSVEVSGSGNTITANELPLFLTNTVVAPAGVTFDTATCNTNEYRVYLDVTTGGPITVSGGSCMGTPSVSAFLAGVRNDVTVGMALTSGVSIGNSGAAGTTITFTGPITSTTSGIQINASPNANVVFSGAVDITGAVPFRVQTGGRIALTNGTNRLAATGSNPALELTDTTIAPAGLSFRSITAPGPGIYATNLGSLGGLIVTGTGVANSGGSMTSVQINGGAGHAFRYMNIDGVNTSGSAVDVRNARGFTLQDSTVDGYNTINVLDSARVRLLSTTVTSNMHAITFDGVVGVGAGDRSELTGTSATAQLGSAFRMNNTRSTNAPSVPATYAAGVTARTAKDTLVVSGGSSFTTANASMPAVDITGSNASNHYVQLIATLTGSGVRVTHPSNTGVLDFELGGSTITGASGRAVDLYGSGNGAGNGLMFDIKNNTISTAAGGSGIYAASYNGTPRGFITTNTITGAGGSSSGIAINGSMIVGMGNTGSNGGFALGNSISLFNNAVWLVNPVEIHAQIMGLSGSGAAAGLNLAAADGLICVNLGSNNFTSTGGSAYSIFQNAAGTLTMQTFTGNGSDPNAIRNFIWTTNAGTPTVNAFGSPLHVQNGACTLP